MTVLNSSSGCTSLRSQQRYLPVGGIIALLCCSPSFGVNAQLWHSVWDKPQASIDAWLTGTLRWPPLRAADEPAASSARGRSEIRRIQPPVSDSTISRTLQRNSFPYSRDGGSFYGRSYGPVFAQDVSEDTSDDDDQLNSPSFLSYPARQQDQSSLYADQFEDESVSGEDSPAGARPFNVWELDKGSLVDFGSEFPDAEYSKSIEDFEGRWQVLVSRSDSLDPILTALGIGGLRQLAVRRYASVTSISRSAGYNGEASGYISLTTTFPAGVVKSISMPLNGDPVRVNDDDAGHWETRMVFLNGRLLQVRSGPKGEMLDTRVVFPNDPQGSESGPVMLFRWTLSPSSGFSTPITVDRWLKRLSY